MLLHHFGSRDELLVAIVEEVERRQTAMFDDLPDDPAAPFTAMWADLRRPELRPFERLFFECYARAAQGEEPFTRLLPKAVDGWLADGRPSARAAPSTRRWPASASPSPAACCSTSSRPATRRASTPRRRPSPPSWAPPLQPRPRHDRQFGAQTGQKWPSLHRHGDQGRRERAVR